MTFLVNSPVAVTATSLVGRFARSALVLGAACAVVAACWIVAGPGRPVVREVFAQAQAQAQEPAMTASRLAPTPSPPLQPPSRQSATPAATPASSPATAATSATAASFYGALLNQPGAFQSIAALGRTLFFDRRLSASGRTSCASCHDPAHAYGPPNGRSVQLAGPSGREAGTRAVPSLRYLQDVPVFTEHFHEGENDSVDQGPTGGHTWDGRADSVHDQARLPLLSPLEMANADAAAVVRRVRAAGHEAALRQVFGPTVDDPQRLFDAVLLSLEVFQQTPQEFYPYTSKYDAYLRGQVALSPREQHGLALFEAPAKGNCATCHPSRLQEGRFPAFTDWGYIALGVPRNRAIAANARADHHDLGLCGPQRTDLRDRAEYCGLFRTPSLRNVAQRHSFFHNGVFHDLRQVLSFYVDRDRHPERWYPHDAKGRVRKFDDLPPAFHDNVNSEAPFDSAAAGPPALTPAEIDDVIAFLKTLDDGYAVPQALAARQR